jgi:Tfp pilus assembly protein PilO
MMKRLKDLLGSLDSRVLTAVLLLILGAVAVEGWMLVLRRPLAEYRQIHGTHLALGASLGPAADQSGELEKVVNELKLLKTKLSGQLKMPASDDEMVASLMGALDHSASRYGIFLSSMTPGPRKQVSVFEEVSFGVNGNGSYLQLCRWMLDFEQTLGGSATITDFDMKTTGEGGQVALAFNIALYRPIHLLEGTHDF